MYNLEPSYPPIGLSHSDPPAVIRLTGVDGFAGVFSSRSYISVTAPQPQKVFKLTLNGVLMGPLWGKECIQPRYLFQHLGASWFPVDSNVGLTVIHSVQWHKVDTASLQYSVVWCHREESGAKW